MQGQAGAGGVPSRAGWTMAFGAALLLLAGAGAAAGAPLGGLIEQAKQDGTDLNGIPTTQAPSGGGGGTGKGICLLGVCTDGTVSPAPEGGPPIVTYDAGADMFFTFVYLFECQKGRDLPAQINREKDEEARARLRKELAAVQASLTPQIQKRYCSMLDD